MERWLKTRNFEKKKPEKRDRFQVIDEKQEVSTSYMGSKEHQNKRKYDDSYLQLGFTSVEDSSPPDAQCVSCY
jgi:hypothetical protein